MNPSQQNRLSEIRELNNRDFYKFLKLTKGGGSRQFKDDIQFLLEMVEELEKADRDHDAAYKGREIRFSQLQEENASLKEQVEKLKEELEESKLNRFGNAAFAECHKTLTIEELTEENASLKEQVEKLKEELEESELNRFGNVAAAECHQTLIIRELQQENTLLKEIVEVAKKLLDDTYKFRRVFEDHANTFTPEARDQIQPAYDYTNKTVEQFNSLINKLEEGDGDEQST